MWDLTLPFLPNH
jgi:hypothetical protein